jgi:hypothetical protein
MKRLLFLLIFISEVAYSANWVKVAATVDGEEVIFIDTQSIQRSGNSVTYWERMNNSTRTKQGDLSSKSQKTINCVTRDFRILYFIFYDDLNNQGKITSSFSADTLPENLKSWKPIVPESIMESSRKYLCK